MAAPYNLGNLGAELLFKWTVFQRNSLASTKLVNQPGNNITNNDQIYEQQEEAIQILAFQDEGSEEVAQAIEQNTNIPAIIPQTSTHEGRVHSIRDFLERVYLLDSFDWVASNTRGQVLKTYRFPDNLLAKNPIANKVNNFFGLRAGVQFIVLVNKQQFQAGNLLISYLPHAKYNGFKADLHSKPYGITSRTGVPRVNLDLMDATRATLDAPYASPFVYYNLLTNEGTIGDFTISVYSPLADVSGSGRVGVKVFARFIDIDLQFPTGQATAVAQSTFSTLVSKVRRLGEGVPNSKLKELKAIKNEITTMIRDFDTLTNHSNDVAVTGFKQKALPNMASANGSNETHMLSLSSTNSLTPMNMGETSTSEMNFQKILNIENYHNHFPITTSQVAGTEVWRETVNPMVLPNMTGLSVPPNVEVHEYLSFISQPFALWRGPIKYNFRVVKTTFHSVRLRVGWSPVTAANSVIDRDACYTEIVDLKDRNQFSFEVPYVYPQPFLSTKTSGSLPLFAGVIFIDIEVQMVAPETVSSSIDVIVERAAGEGFMLNLPTTLGVFPIDTRMTETETRKTPVQGASSIPGVVFDHVNPYLTPVSQEEERFSIPSYNIDVKDLSFFGALSDDIVNKAKELLLAGTKISSQVMTVINDLAIYRYQVLPTYLTMPLDQLISIFENNGGARDFFTQLPQGVLMRKRDTHSDTAAKPKVPEEIRELFSGETRDSSTLINHSAGSGCEKFDQDIMRNLSRDVTFTRPPPALQADNYTLGSSINNVKTMIMRSSRFSVNGKPTPTLPLHIQPHAYAPMAFIAGAPGQYVRPAMDNLSYFAAIYTFARGGVGLRMITGNENYKFIVDPNLRINFESNSKKTPAQIATTAWTLQDSTWVSNDITHVINPSVEGFGEITIPFYSQTYCQAYDMQVATNPYDENLNLRQPKTHLIVYPFTEPVNDWSAFRHACADFEFSMLSGAPAMVSTAVTDPTA